ncbi:MAG: metal ABC transporter ATP-binding protein [Patescibacteria group bacterium]
MPEKKIAIQVEDLTVQFGTDRVLDAISFEIEAGQIVAVIGPNGSGKSTLVKTMLGLEKADRGEITYFGKPLSQAKQLIGYVPQRFSFDKDFPITVKEFLKLRRPEGKNTIEHKLAAVGLKPSMAKQHLGALSGGELQRVLMAQAILNSPQILFLDEANAGIDLAGEQNFLEIIKTLNTEHGTTIVMVSHEIDVVARFVDQVICLNRSLVCHGSPKETLTEKVLVSLFGEEAGLYNHTHRHHH